MSFLVGLSTNILSIIIKLKLLPYTENRAMTYVKREATLTLGAINSRNRQQGIGPPRMSVLMITK